MRDPLSEKVTTVPEDDSIELSSRAHTQGKKKNHYLTVRSFKKLKRCNITFYYVTSKHYLKTMFPLIQIQITQSKDWELNGNRRIEDSFYPDLQVHPH